jgi:hypothetical protein
VRHQRGIRRVFFDEFGWVRIPWVLLGVVLALAAIIFACLVFAAWPLSRSACHQKGDEYGLTSHYRQLSNICYVTLPNGRSVDSDSVQINQLEQVVGR